MMSIESLGLPLAVMIVVRAFHLDCEFFPDFLNFISKVCMVLIILINVKTMTMNTLETFPINPLKLR
jgi:fumarate reductase subunit C